MYLTTNNWIPIMILIGNIPNKIKINDVNLPFNEMAQKSIFSYALHLQFVLCY